VAVIGASPRPGAVGATVWRNLRRASFAGPRWAVKLRHEVVDGEPAFAAKVSDQPATPGLAVVCTPPDIVHGLIAELGAQGARAAAVLSAGSDGGLFGVDAAQAAWFAHAAPRPSAAAAPRTTDRTSSSCRSS
jgi:acyl-CoA synthetase (NDP forming)